MMTRKEIESIRIGTKVVRYMNGREGKPEYVCRIFAKALDINGHLFMCGYTRRTPDATSSMSFSVKENEVDYIRLAREGE